jgi:hypothetical protein
MRPAVPSRHRQRLLRLVGQTTLRRSRENEREIVKQILPPITQMWESMRDCGHRVCTLDLPLKVNQTRQLVLMSL